MIKLYTFGEKFGVADPSPFVLKVDAYLRMAGIDFENINRPDNLSKAPKGKLPFIIDGDKTIADSQAIIEYIKTNPDNDLDKPLSDEQRAVAYLVTKSLDENLYFVLVYSRWLRDDTWPLIKEAFFSQLPFPLKYLVPNIVKKQVSKALKGQGIARHSNEELQHILHCSLKSLSDLLGAKKYFFGDNPSSLDSAAFGFLAELILVDIDNPFNNIAKSYPSLVDYCRNIQAEYYSDS